MKHVVLGCIPLLMIPFSALAQTDPAPSGTETQVIIHDPNTGTNIGMPGADGTVNQTVEPGRQTLDFDPGGNEVNGQVDDNTTIETGD